ncbi:ribonuclease III domain-containing protein [Collybia nuda]|uniref:Ribonuclease III domain-containing protein n=1 Tax=Collybia nuda TaxID=64659 RepID=A0A9P6CG41_9AGAR|nr:ribonuclease III domain-containing protein [Collybia nuda]
MALKPDFGLNDTLFPPLPIIKKLEISTQAFTHRSLHARPTHVFEDRPDDPSPDNEKYEHLGDTVLQLMVTSLMLEMHPGLRVGPSTKIRAMIVGNSTLAEISLKYKLPDRLRLHPAQAITLRASTHIQADVFESFVGGLYLDQGLAVVKRWLDPLFRPYVTAAYHIVRKEHGLPPMPTPSPSPSPGSSPVAQSTSTELMPTTTIGHLALFNQHLQKHNCQVEWIYSDKGFDNEDPNAPKDTLIRGTKTTPVWFVKVMVDGTFYGRGRGNTKKAARNEAAKGGLEMMGIFVW